MSVDYPVRCYVGLGSNLGDPYRQVKSAIESLGRVPSTRLGRVSRLYTSTPLGDVSQPDYCNAVAELVSRLSPYRLFSYLQQIERQHGRIRGERWGARTLDLDLLLYGPLVMCSELLAIPHPGLSKRDFVLYPLAEIAPHDLAVPGQGRLEELLAQCPLQFLKDPL